VDGDAAEPAVDLLALAEVDALAHVEPELLHRGYDRRRERNAGAGSAKVARKPSPAVSCSRPPCPFSSRLTTCRNEAAS